MCVNRYTNILFLQVFSVNVRTLITQSGKGTFLDDSLSPAKTYRARFSDYRTSTYPGYYWNVDRNRNSAKTWYYDEEEKDPAKTGRGVTIRRNDGGILAGIEDAPAIDLRATYGGDIEANFKTKYNKGDACVVGILEIAKWQTYALKAVTLKDGSVSGHVIARSLWTTTEAIPFLSGDVTTGKVITQLRDFGSLFKVADKRFKPDGRTYITVDQKLAPYSGNFGSIELLIRLGLAPPDPNWNQPEAQ